MLWNHYLHDAGHAIQKGLETGLHTLEGALATYGTLKGGWELAQAVGGGLRTFGAAAAPAAAIAML